MILKNKIKLFITDIDGVWTDGSMYYSDDGIELKRFNTYDSAGVLLCHELGIHVAIITGENSNAVKKRAYKLNIEHCFLGVSNKVKVANQLMKELKIDSYENVAFIGDDINDFRLLNKVGLSACPNQAPELIKKNVDWVIPVKGGDGVFRAFVETYLSKLELLDQTYSKLIKKKYIQ